MKIKDIMRTPVISVNENASLREAAALLSSSRVNGLPVVNSAGDMVGIITEHDIIKTLMPSYQDILTSDAAVLSADLMESHVYHVRDRSVGSLMTKQVVTLQEGDTLLKAASAMILKRVKMLPVVRGTKPVGIVSRIDIVNALMQGGL